MSELTAKQERLIRYISEDFTTEPHTERRLYEVLLARIIRPMLEEQETQLDIIQEQEEKSARDYWRGQVEDLEDQIKQSDELFTVADELSMIVNLTLPLLARLKSDAGERQRKEIERLLIRIRKVQETTGKGILPKIEKGQSCREN